VSKSKPPSFTGARTTPSVLTTLADVTTFFQVEIGSVAA